MIANGELVSGAAAEDRAAVNIWGRRFTVIAVFSTSPQAHPDH
jgi:hypothetical protein